MKLWSGLRRVSLYQKITQDAWPLLTIIWLVITRGKLYKPLRNTHRVNYLQIYRLGHTRTALIYLEKALELEGFLEDSSFKADTHLNISAVLS